MAISHSFRTYNRVQTNLIDCFAGAATKCGYVDDTKEEILENINLLNLSPEKARKVILDAWDEDEKYLNKLTNQKNLDERELKIIDSIKRSELYYKRVLEVIDEMEDK